MFLVLSKIDWDSFVRDFPSRQDTWSRNLESDDFDYLCEDSFAAEWIELAQALESELPQALRQPFSQLIEVVFPEDEGVELPHTLTETDKEQFAYPHFDPAGMQEIFRAIEVLEAQGLESLVRKAWAAVDEKAGCDTQFFEDVDEFITYMNIWLAVLAELKRDNCVLGHTFV